MKALKKETELIAILERRAGNKIGTKEERMEGFKKLSKEQLERFRNGLTDSLYGRLNLDNDDMFDSDIEQMKTKILRENLEIIDNILKN